MGTGDFLGEEMAEIIDGKKISLIIQEELRVKTATLSQAFGVVPGLAVILVGNDPASEVYVRNKKNACERLGFLSRQIALPSEISQGALLEQIAILNEDEDIHGILVQLPLPKHISTDAVIEAIAPRKDVDGFHPYNIGRLFAGLPAPRACTPAGIMVLLEKSGIGVVGKHVVIVGRSNIVGKPLALMFIAQSATVTVCHSQTVALGKITKEADILVAALGKPRFISAAMVKHGATVIDVGVNRLADGTLAGDVDFSEVAPLVSHITPVPGGVGPMTIAMLMNNTLIAAQCACAM